ncbi:hypothetical protein ID47_03625 [Candidatus Paracaedibacter acanthamoebae]|uniref:Uncharacterized protein n=1 Tax=Candidatus Odyssella acanthamoebae TaxID=91604 RepID=A0A077AS79_9PROT|nr:hypothetical protein ID47_03625 [Candidatus Paracaedibacter acanthamoebae]
MRENTPLYTLPGRAYACPEKEEHYKKRLFPAEEPGTRDNRLAPYDIKTPAQGRGYTYNY